MYLRLIYWRFYIALGFWASKEFYMIIYLLCRSLLNLDIYFRHHWSASKNRSWVVFAISHWIVLPESSSSLFLETVVLWDLQLVVFGVIWLRSFYLCFWLRTLMISSFWSKMRRSWRWRGIFVSSGSRLAGMRQSAINHFYQVLND